MVHFSLLAETSGRHWSWLLPDDALEGAKKIQQGGGE